MTCHSPAANVVTCATAMPTVTNIETLVALVTKLNVPISQIDKMFPEIVLRRGKRNLNKRPPLWPFGFADQAHVRLARKPIALVRIAGDTRANDIFPRCCSSLISRHNVIQIEFAAIKHLPAILAGVLVTLENVVTSKFARRYHWRFSLSTGAAPGLDGC